MVSVFFSVGFHSFDFGRRHISKRAAAGRSREGHDLQCSTFVIAPSLLYVFVCVSSHLHILEIQRSGPIIHIWNVIMLGHHLHKRGLQMVNC